MRRGWVLLVVLGCWLALGMTWLSLAPRLPPAWQAPLADYLTLRAPDATLRWVEPARKPQNFAPQMSVTAYQASRVYGAPSFITLDETLQPQVAEPLLVEAASSGVSWLPFPPEMAWCALLAQAGGDQTVIIIAQHSDIYNAEVVTHEVSPAARPDILAQIGCERSAAEFP